MKRSCALALTMLLAACGKVAPAGVGDAAPAADAGATADGPTAPPDGAPPDGAPATCDGYEPCGVNPVVVPDGYALQAFVSYDDYGIYGTCTSFEDCGMWNTHFTSNWVDGNTGQPVDPYYNRMSSPFPWSGSRYEIDVPPKKIAYAAFHMTAPGDLYVFGDGVPEMRTDRTTGAVTCFRRGPGHMESARLYNLGGTGNTGAVTWNISVLPGDMGNSGNASTCTGTGATATVLLTSDPDKAASTVNANGDHVYCLLREGQTYYVNFMSHGVFTHVDCSTDTCRMGGFFVGNYAGSDGAMSPVVEEACP